MKILLLMFVDVPVRDVHIQFVDESNVSKVTVG